MRIIAGKYRGRKLKSPPSIDTRPTSDRLRETLFNILAPRIQGARFLDLCAGTGAVGIEALSRGAESAAFVDQSKKMCALIETNVSAIGIGEDEVEVIATEALDFLRRHARKNSPPFDIVFFDPPYAIEYDDVLKYISANTSQLLTESAMVIVEHLKKMQLAEEFGALYAYRVLKQGDSALSFYRCERGQ
jgi:16S rRNA (guanine966-N2)-methyltransferase